MSKISNPTKKQNTYTSEFKGSAIKLAIESNQSVAKTAKDLGVKLIRYIPRYGNIQYQRWYLKDTDEHIYDENKRLKKELARVTQERDSLKKGHRIFAKEISLSTHGKTTVFRLFYYTFIPIYEGFTQSLLSTA